MVLMGSQSREQLLSMFIEHPWRGQRSAWSFKETNLVGDLDLRLKSGQYARLLRKRVQSLKELKTTP